MVKIINLTPHQVTLVGEGGEKDFLPSGLIARAKSKAVPVDCIEVDGSTVEVRERQFGAPILLEGDKEVPFPDFTNDVYYIVSKILAEACPLRGDLLIPDETVRDENGRIKGCRAFARLPRQKMASPEGEP